MNDHINMLFLDNLNLEEQIEAFCEKSPEYQEVRRRFFEAAHEIAAIVDFQLYDRFETSFGQLLSCSNDLYYLFGLGLRQEVLKALQPEMS